MYICSVLDCYLLCEFFCFLCEQNCFQSNLNPKEFYFNVNLFFLTVFVLHWLKISVVCCLQFQFNCWNLYLFFDTWQRVLVVRLWKPHKPECYSVFCFVLDFFWYSLSFFPSYCELLSLFVLTERCGMCNTANCNLCRPRIVALYFLSMGFVSVQAEITCIFQMFYL